MTRRRVEDDAYGRLWRRLDELARRVDEGTLDQGRVMEILTHTIEGRMPKLLSTAGIEIAGFLPVMTTDSTITTLERVDELEEKGCIRTQFDREMFLSLRNKSEKVGAEVGVLRYARFSSEDDAPGTKRVLRDMRDNGLRPGTANQFLAALSDFPAVGKNWGRYVIALGSVTVGNRCLRYEADPLGYRYRLGTLNFVERLQPWWPSCYSFFVVKGT